MTPLAYLGVKGDQSFGPEHAFALLSDQGPFWGCELAPKTADDACQYVCMMAHCLSACCLGVGGGRAKDLYTGDSLNKGQALVAVDGLMRGQLYVWSYGCCKAATETDIQEPLPEESLLPLPSDIVTFVFPQPAYSIQVPGDSRRSIDWVSVVREHGTVNGRPGSMLAIVIGVCPDSESGSMSVAVLPYGGPDSALAVKYLTFLSSEYIPKTKRKLARSRRRQLTRRNPDLNPDSDVTFLDLRLPHYDPGPSPGQSREYRHHWLVRGHIRRQWHPSTKEHKLKWIPPYIKGDTDKPFLDHVYRVVN